MAGKGFWRPAVAVFLALLLFSPLDPAAAAVGLSGRSDELSNGKSALSIPETGLSEEQKIVHLLNRIGFGPRPGDVERVKQIGMARYLEQQLNSQSVSDSEVEKRLASLKTLHMSSMQLLAAYPPPQLLRQIERRLSSQMGMDPEAAGTLFPELERRRDPSTSSGRAPSTSSGRGEESAPRRQARTPEERMEQALRSPARIVLELSQAKLVRAIYSDQQLQEVMTDFWFNHFNIFIGKGADRWLTPSYEQEAIRPHVLGKFRDLLGATASHPAMLFYLDNWLSADPKADYDERDLRRRYAAHLREQGIEPGALMVDILRQRGMDTTQVERILDRMEAAENRSAARGRRGVGNDARRRPGDQQQPAAAGRRRGLNENYARELLELHTLGVDGGYTQQDIIEVARSFTGWTILPVQFGQGFLYVDELHDKGTKTVLGQKIQNSGQRDGERVLDIVARHPSTARFISLKLARRFVSDQPPATLVEKMAKTFRESDGDIRAVLRTLFSSEEFWAPAAVNAKLKTPFEFVVSAARATGAEVNSLLQGPGSSPSDRAGDRRQGPRRGPGLVLALRELGQPLYACQPPTGYKDTAEVWVSSGALLNRMKVALELAASRLPGVRVNLPTEWSQARSPEELIAQVGQSITGRSLSSTTQQALAGQLQTASTAGDGSQLGQSSAPLVLGWVLASPEFQRR